jgi:hypothetical protein
MSVIDDNASASRRQELIDALRPELTVLQAHPFDSDDPFWSAARSESIHLLLIAAARLVGAEKSWHHDAIERAARVLTHASLLAASRELELRRVLDAFAAKGLTCLLMKGAPLAYTHYPDPALRPRQDTDILVHREQVHPIIGVLVSLGYVKAVQTSGDLLTFQARLDFARAARGMHAFDLHWKIANPRVFGDSLEYDALADSAVPVPALGPHARALSTIDALYLACLHRIAHHQDRPDLLWLWDIHLLASSLSDSEADRFVGLAMRARMRAVCCRSLDLASRSFGTARASALSERLRPAADAPPEPSARFIGCGSRPIDLLLADLATLSTWRDRVALIGEHLFPPVSYMRAASPRYGAPWLPLAYVRRIARGASSWFRPQ